MPPRAVVARFFFAGDGVLHLHHAHFGTDLSVRFRGIDGSYDAESLERLRHFFRSRSDDKTGPLSLRLVELLDYVEDRFEPSRMVLYSAYRSPELNAALPGTARASLHTQGLAADVGLEGVALAAAWRQMRALGAGGMGYYARDGLLHVDAGVPRFWEASTSGVGKDLSGGNARVFARTEFDRYATIDGLRLTLHGVTAVPLGLRIRVDPGAELVGESAGIESDGECLWIRGSADEYRFVLRTKSSAPHPGSISDAPVRLELATCGPRIGRTPESIATNRIELVDPQPLPKR
jgi:uncharacterized protein YcbK (DUF882 family)